ncbi:hypothetical protein [Natrinema salaciae]|uniref:Uncharacterized protein n=1 Tax=Natrinema salaciae TaxID=1186196 RepID=A0A1H9GL02_9EURY|nr:hypothetical protein [Natrinema salaciae]SEQ50693.1 hypothetical protein SAMN04489841_1917 [Natrinema salaciae]
MVHRRQILLTTLAAGATATAGCVGDDPSDENSDDQSANSSDENVPPDLELTSDGVYRIDIDAVSDRSASIGDSQVTYDGDPEVIWAYERAFEFDRPSESTPELAVDPVIDTTDDVGGLFLAPVYDADAEGWQINAYADETYYEARDTHQFWIGQFHAEPSEERAVSDLDATFTEHHDGIYRAIVEYGETPPADKHSNELQSVVLANSTWDETALEETDPILGVAVGPTRVGPTSPDYNEADEDDPAPVVDFSFEYDQNGKTITIVHEDGPAFQGEHVQVGFEGGLTEAQFSGEIAADDELTVEVPNADPGEYLAIAWRGADREYYIVLDRFQIPE